MKGLMCEISSKIARLGKRHSEGFVTWKCVQPQQPAIG